MHIVVFNVYIYFFTTIKARSTYNRWVKTGSDLLSKKYIQKTDPLKYWVTDVIKAKMFFP